MKKFIFIPLLMIIVSYSFYSNECLCQWYYQSLPSYYDVADIKFFDENTGLMIFSTSYHGMLRTTNGGNNWTLLYPSIAYYQLEKICGRRLVKLYNLTNGVMFCFLAGAMVTVSATALGVWFKFRMPELNDMYPNSIGWVIAVLFCGGMIALVAAYGYNTVAKKTNETYVSEVNFFG